MRRRDAVVKCSVKASVGSRPNVESNDCTRARHGCPSPRINTFGCASTGRIIPSPGGIGVVVLPERVPVGDEHAVLVREVLRPGPDSCSGTRSCTPSSATSRRPGSSGSPGSRTAACGRCSSGHCARTRCASSRRHRSETCLRAAPFTLMLLTTKPRKDDGLVGPVPEADLSYPEVPPR